MNLFQFEPSRFSCYVFLALLYGVDDTRFILKISLLFMRPLWAAFLRHQPWSICGLFHAQQWFTALLFSVIIWHVAHDPPCLMACYQTNVLPGTLSCQFQPFLVGFVCFQLSALVCISGLRTCFQLLFGSPDEFAHDPPCLMACYQTNLLSGTNC